MSLNYKILLAKPKLVRSIDDENTQYIDLLPKTFNPGNISLYRPTYIVINRDYVARPDLVSLMVYGTDEYADIICKVNGISNPFELNEDYLIVLPNPEMLKNMIGSAVPSEVISKYKEVESTAIESTGGDNIGTKVSNFKKLLSEKRSPNEQTLDSSNYVVNKKYGLVYY